MSSMVTPARRVRSLQGREDASTASSEWPSLFDALREDAIQRSFDHANPEWRDAAHAAVICAASARADFTSDDVWLRIPTNLQTHNPSALGPVILRAAKAGLIRKTGETRRSRLGKTHRDLVVWERA